MTAVARVAVTGLGAVSALGIGVPRHLAAVANGQVGIGPLDAPYADRVKNRIVGQARDYRAEDHFDPRRLGLLDRVTQLALVAAREAVTDAGDVLKGIRDDRAGCILGAAVGTQTLDEMLYEPLYAKGATRFNPLIIPRVMPNAPASNVTIEHGIHGATFAVASACASAAHAIGLAFQMVRGGLLDVAVAGGGDASITLGGLKSWEGVRVMSTDTCRPFSLDRSGFVLGEGAGILILENLERAQARGARIHGEIVGFGMSADGRDITAPDPATAAKAMRWALDDAGLVAADVDYVNAHGTGTSLNDKTETLALRELLGRHLERVPVSSSKSMLGHCMGAAGALELVITVLALREGLLPPTMNFTTPDPECDIDCVPNASRRVDIDVALSNAFAFGGLNAVLAMRRYAG